MLRVAISGVAGRMGNVLVQAISVANDLELSAAFESKTSPVIGKDVGEVVGVGQLGVTVSDSPHKHIEDFDIVIDFSVPEATLALGEICREHAKPMVIGTTGFSASQLDMLGEYSGEFPIFISPNMSLGVNILFRLVSEASAAFGGEVDCEILEAHHSKKIDAPSGTASRLGEIIAQNLSRNIEDSGVYGRKGNVGERSEKEIGFSSIRGGDIVGDHTVFFIGEGERIEITHRAQSRMNFAQGAIRATRFLSRQKNGLYDMEQLLEMS